MCTLCGLLDHVLLLRIIVWRLDSGLCNISKRITSIRNHSHRTMDFHTLQSNSSPGKFVSYLEICDAHLKYTLSTINQTAISLKKVNIFWNFYVMFILTFTVHSRLASKSAFALSKTIEAMVIKLKCKEWILYPFSPSTPMFLQMQSWNSTQTKIKTKMLVLSANRPLNTRCIFLHRRMVFVGRNKTRRRTWVWSCYPQLKMGSDCCPLSGWWRVSRPHFLKK